MRAKKWLWMGAIVALLLLMATVWWLHRFQRYTPVEVARDLRAAMQVKGHPRPVERFLELRYGPLDLPTNRHQAFLDFFNPGHVEGLHLLTSRLPAERRKTNIQAMAQWLAQYRQQLLPEEKQMLAAYFRTPEGRRAIESATAKYLSQDVYYRAETAPVIRELMNTLNDLQSP
ncbi:MAG: hypothetical protein N3J91_13520 [Verrucomicrobiae bacterium]|nr:hypothetical protein [Verrucomicrobiae bacterium]